MAFLDRFKRNRPAGAIESPVPEGNRFSDHRPTRDRSAAYNNIFGNFVGGFADEHPTANCPLIDLFHFGPHSDGRPYHTLVTSGMSDRKMIVPTEHQTIPCRAEIVMYVKEPRDEHYLWVKWAAKFPFIDNTYLNHGHTIPWHEPLFPGSELSCILFINSIVREDNELSKTLVIEGDPVNLLWFLPITRQEWALKKESGISALLDLFDKHRHPVQLDEDRRSYV